jgi:hypothetical protein
VAHDNDVLDPKVEHGELDCRADAVELAASLVGGTRLATLRTTNSSPGMALKIVSGSTRLSLHEMTIASGVCP